MPIITSAQKRSRARHQGHTGITAAQAAARERELGIECSFADVRRACHRFLMERDLHYRQQREAYEAGRISQTRRFTPTA